MSGELPHNLTHQDQRRRLVSYSDSLVHTTGHIYTVPNLTSKLASSNDPMYAESRCFGLETEGAIGSE